MLAISMSIPLQRPPAQKVSKPRFYALKTCFQIGTICPGRFWVFIYFFFFHLFYIIISFFKADGNPSWEAIAQTEEPAIKAEGKEQKKRQAGLKSKANKLLYIWSQLPKSYENTSCSLIFLHEIF